MISPSLPPPTKIRALPLFLVFEASYEAQPHLSLTASSKFLFYFPGFHVRSLPTGQGRCNAELQRASGWDGAGGLTDNAALGREAGGEFRAHYPPPPARKWLFKDKHLRPGSVCRNLHPRGPALSTGLSHQSKNSFS